MTRDDIYTSNSKAWVTLLTQKSYLAGVVLLAHSLHVNQSKYPLLILYTDTLPLDCIQLLTKEAALSNAYLLQVDLLFPRHRESSNGSNGQVQNGNKLIAARFADTWTKLRAFQLYQQYERLVFLDADMLVYQNMDELFSLPLPGQRGEWIAANHGCVCNRDSDPWAPTDWQMENCAHTGIVFPNCRRPVPNEGYRDYRRTYTMLNSGLFVFEPTKATWNGILDFLDTNPLVADFNFPDQDLLAEYFRGKWISIGYQYNALKTSKYWHPEMWRDEEIKNLHYIVDKPWSSRVTSDGVAGYLGRDGVTHQWWWNQYAMWEAIRMAQGEIELLKFVRSEVAKPLIAGQEPENLHGNWRAAG